MIDKIKTFIEKWGGVICTTLIIILCLYALGCCIYTAIVANVIVGILGIIGIILACAILAYIMYDEIKTTKEIKDIIEKRRDR